MKTISLNRRRYDFKTRAPLKFSVKPGLNGSVVKVISKRKKEPEWLLRKRLNALSAFKKLKMPDWSPDISGLNLNKITYYAEAFGNEANSWENVPAEIRLAFERLGIPEAERRQFAGAGAQFESSMAYHKLKNEWEDEGVIFENFDEAVKKYPALIKEYFMTSCVPVNYHKFAALHGAVFSGGTFIYVPKGVKVRQPLQAYFRMNAESMGQFEHTLIIIDEGAEAHYIEGCSAPRYNSSSLHAGCVEIFVKRGARMRYSSIENWSKNTYNLNTKKAVVEEDGIMEWVSGNMGSGLTMLYPCSILRGQRAKTDFLSIAFAGDGQTQDTGAKVIHLAPDTSSTVVAKTIARGGGITTFRGLIKITKGAKGASTKSVCDSLLFDKRSKTNTYPYTDIKERHAKVAHEASVGRVGEEQLFYLQSRGLTEPEAVRLIVSGFVEPVAKKLPFEYAFELNRLIEMEMEGSVG